MKNLGRRAGAGFLIALMNLNVVEVAWSKNVMLGKGVSGYPELLEDVETIDSFGSTFNANAKDKNRVATLLTSFEKILNRPLDNAERQFLTLEFATVDSLPRFEVKDNIIQIYDTEDGSKDLLLSIEIVDIEKSIFKFGQRTFQLDPAKPIHENVQLILKELQKGEKVTLWQQVNPFGVPQAHAAMATWLKIVLVAAVALVAGFFIGKLVAKNKDKKDAEIAEAKSRKEESSSEADHDGEAANINEQEATPAVDEEEPALV